MCLPILLVLMSVRAHPSGAWHRGGGMRLAISLGMTIVFELSLGRREPRRRNASHDFAGHGACLGTIPRVHGTEEAECVSRLR